MPKNFPHKIIFLSTITFLVQYFRNKLLVLLELRNAFSVYTPLGVEYIYITRFLRNNNIIQELDEKERHADTSECPMNQEDRRNDKIIGDIQLMNDRQTDIIMMTVVVTQK